MCVCLVCGLFDLFGESVAKPIPLIDTNSEEIINEQERSFWENISEENIFGFIFDDLCCFLHVRQFIESSFRANASRPDVVLLMICGQSVTTLKN